MTTDIHNALLTLKQGGVILYPTDTIWGLGCDATNEAAVKRIFEIKQRSQNNSMLVLLDNAAYLSYYMNEVPPLAYDLIELSEKPITIIYPGARNIAPSLISANGSIGIRITTNDFCKQLIAKFRKPIVSTSANISGKPSPQFFDQIDEEIINAVDYVVKHNQNDLSRKNPSGIIKLGLKGEIEIIRK